MIRTKHYLVRGRVQGVGYRYFVLAAAKSLGVCGYVRNLHNGDVEVHAEAEEQVLSHFRKELESGPRSAHVSGIIEQDLPETESYTSFLIRG